MSDTPQLCDRSALTLHRARATNEALFLHREAVAEVQDRIELVNKPFTSVAIVTPFPEIWSAAFPDAKFLADTDLLDVSEQAHDLIIHAMALHWSNDPVGQLIQCQRALQPDGFFLAVLLGGQTLHELRASLGQAEAEISGGLSPRVAPMGEIRDCGALLQRAGYALPVADSVALNVSYETPLHVMRELRAMGESNALTARIKHFTRRAVLVKACKHYAKSFADTAGRVTATFELITLSGWAPDSSQPQPLRPGSAAQRLADALNTVETSLKD